MPHEDARLLDQTPRQYSRDSMLTLLRAAVDSPGCMIIRCSFGVVRRQAPLGKGNRRLPVTSPAFCMSLCERTPGAASPLAGCPTTQRILCSSCSLRGPTSFILVSSTIR